MPDLLQAGRVGAHGGSAARGQASMDADETIAHDTGVPRILQGIEETTLERPSRRTNK